MLLIKPECIILSGKTTQPGFCNTKYIVFCQGTDVKIAGNQEEWQMRNEDIVIDPQYTRTLLTSVYDLWELTINEIENDAYGAWMDGAK